MKITLLLAAVFFSFTAFAQPLPLDPAIRTGKLPNGFTYYIRKNTEPAKRVQLYLVNKVGSVLEEENQRGLAHFMEHMSFNGTTHYPKNELVHYLQKSGVRFGADLNAFTSFRFLRIVPRCYETDCRSCGTGRPMQRLTRKRSTTNGVWCWKKRDWAKEPRKGCV